MITTFVVYKDWKNRPPGFSQAHLLVTLQRRLKSIPQATFAVVPPSRIPGLGNAFGFQMMIEDRGNGNLQTLQTVTRNILRAAEDRPGFLRTGFTTFSANSPQISVDINPTMARSLGVPLSSVFQALQTYLGSSYVNLFNKYDQSFQVRVQADARYRRSPPDISNLDVANRHGQMVQLGALVSIRRVVGFELITRFNLYPAATIIGVPAPGTTVRDRP